MNVLILQDYLPEYRVPFYNIIRTKSLRIIFSKYQNCEHSENFITRTVTNFPFGFYYTHLTEDDLCDVEAIVLNGKYKNLNTWLLFLEKSFGMRDVALVYWGHYFSRKPSIFRRFIKHIFLRIFDKIIFYTQCEVELASKSGVSNSFYINNSCIEAGRFLNNRYYESTFSNSLVFIGRPTVKSQFEVLLRFVELHPELTVNFVGVSSSEIPTHLVVPDNAVLHGAIYDFDRLALITSSCRFGVYLGEVGLSLLTYASLALPVILMRGNHMPEFCYLKTFDFAIIIDSVDQICDATRVSKSEYISLVFNAVQCASVLTVENMAQNFLDIIDR